MVWSDEIVFVQNEKEHHLRGEILVTAEDESCLFRDVDSRLWLIKSDEIKSKTDVEEAVPPLTQKEVAANVLAGLPSDFRTESTDHFVVAYNTERAYAKYIGGLYERLLRGFTNHWKSKRKWKLKEPVEPLVAIVFRNYDEYAAFVKNDIGIDPPATMVAYYNLMTNRVVMYDLTSQLVKPGQKLEDDRQIMEILANPNAIAMITTIIHEGTHQLMFNMGMQQRLAATPIWVNEGLAMYFEPPDLSANSGWRAIGQINQLRLTTLRQALAARPRAPGQLELMLTDDAVFRDQEQLLDRYAEAWGFNYFLLTKYSKEYVDYLKFLSEKPPLVEDSPETRLADFRKFFAKELVELDREFMDYIRNLR
jgi:Protein of unknown function (DUF1570)